MIIIEGPDGVGKTTLAKKLLGHLMSHVYAHFTRLPPGFDYYWGYVDRMSRYVVQDRFHMSEVAYAEARGDDLRVDPETYRLLDGRLRLLGAYTVLVTATEDLVRERWDPTQMYDVERTLSACRVFNRIASDNRHDIKYRGYLFDVDHVVRCHEGSPYATDDDVDRVIGEYRVRQSAVSRATARAAARL
jgi:GTPase SAR1 family protein